MSADKLAIEFSRIVLSSEMQANKGKTNYNESCHKDLQRQQERLKTMSAATDKNKTLSADVMIENLLKDTFKKPNQVSVPVEKTDHFYSELPFWLQCESTAVPSQYKHFWSLVALTTERADTQKVSQLLLTSGLQVDVLGFIWNLANKVIPGQLTKQEFYIVLALVGLAQTGCAFNSLNVLKQIPVPSIPILQGNLLANTVVQNSVPQNTDIPSFNSFNQIPVVPPLQLTNQKNKSESASPQIKSLRNTTFFTEKQNVLYSNDNGTSTLASGSISYGCDNSSNGINIANQKDMNLNRGPSKSSNFPYIGSSPTLELEDDFSEFQSVSAKNTETVECTTSSKLDDFTATDDFTDFQSANMENLDPFETVVVSQTREIPKILLPKSFSEKFTNLKSTIIKISPESERRLKVLSTTESLSSLPESKISSTNKVSTSISVLGGSGNVGNRLANHSYSGKPDKEKCYKHQKLKVIPGPSVNTEEEIIFGVKPMYIENLMPKCHPKSLNNSKSFVLKETKIKNDDILKSSGNDENGSISNFSNASSKENTRQIEIPLLGTFNETVLPTQKKLTSCTPDLISVQEDKYSALREIDFVLNQENNDKNDEFGDFLSANISLPISVKTDSAATPMSSLFFENDETKISGNLNLNTESKKDLIVSGLKNSIIDEESSTSVIKKEAEDLFDTFTSLTFTEKSESSKHMPASKPSDEQVVFPNTKTNSKISNKDDILLFYDQNDKNSLSSQPKPDQFNNQLETEFWDFLSNEVKPPVEATLSRQGSLPSLDLKICAVDESEQEVVWRKCLETCHNLIQEGFEKFNSIRVKSVLDEVFSATKTGHYLNCLYIVYQISKRISQNFSDLPSIQEELERLWGRLQELCFEYNIKLTSFEEEVSEGISQCCICLKYIVCDLINQGTYSYHPSCANLWINFVEKTLPFST